MPAVKQHSCAFLKTQPAELQLALQEGGVIFQE